MSADDPWKPRPRPPQRRDAERGGAAPGPRHPRTRDDKRADDGLRIERGPGAFGPARGARAEQAPQRGSMHDMVDTQGRRARRDARPRDAHDELAHPQPHTHDAAHRREELRLYGLNAVRASFAKRPEALRKLYLAEARIPALQPLLKWCVAHRVGYRVVEPADLDRLAASTHHEGVVADVQRAEPQPLSSWLRELPEGPACALWLDGVGNPHNFGAILRSAAHFGVSAVLLPKESPLALSGAAARVAEGGADAVPLVRLGRSDNSLAQLRGAGFMLAATVVKDGRDVFDLALPERLVLVMGAEGEGMDRALADACDVRVSIGGTGAVESLNVAAATAVMLAAWRHRR